MPGFSLSSISRLKCFPFLDFSDLRQLLHYGYVGQVFSAVFAAQHLRLRMIEGNRFVDIGIAFR